MTPERIEKLRVDLNDNSKIATAKTLIAEFALVQIGNDFGAVTFFKGLSSVLARSIRTAPPELQHELFKYALNELENYPVDLKQAAIELEQVN